MKILGLKSKVRFANDAATITGITTKGLTLLKDKGGTVEMTFAEAEDFLREKMGDGRPCMEVLEV
jgi:hypothetical protein